MLGYSKAANIKPLPGIFIIVVIIIIIIILPCCLIYFYYYRFFYYLHTFYLLPLLFHFAAVPCDCAWNVKKMMLKSTDQRGTEVIGRLSYTANIDNGFMWDDAYASERLDCMAQVSVGRLWGNDQTDTGATDLKTNITVHM